MNGNDVLKKISDEEFRHRELILYYQKEIKTLESYIPKKEKQLSEFKKALADVLNMDTKTFTKEHPKH